MPILKKKHHERNYTEIPNELLRRSDMSLPAKGLLCYMLSCSEDWKFSIKGLSSVLNTSEHLIQKYLEELESLNYHAKEAIRDESGKIVEWKYYISEQPDVNLSHLVDLPTNKEQEKKENNKNKNLFAKCCDAIEEEFADADIKEELKTYLTIRIKCGKINAVSFRTIIKELNELADTKTEAIDIIRNATAKGYMKFYKVSTAKKKTGYIDNITKDVDDETVLRRKYKEAMYGKLPEERIPFEDWRKENV